MNEGQELENQGVATKPVEEPKQEKSPSREDRLKSWLRFSKYVLRHPYTYAFDAIFAGLLDDTRITPEYFLPENFQEEERPLNMETYGHRDVIELFTGLKEKEGRKLCVIVLGGGQAGNNSAGVLVAMEAQGALAKADGLIGVSAGIPNMEYIMTGQGELGASIYREENTRGSFIKLPKDIKARAGKLWQTYQEGPKSAIMDTDYVVNTVFKKIKPLDVEQLKASDKELLAVVMNARTAQPEYIDTRKVEDPFEVIEAGVNVPGITSKPVVKLENGEEYVDGGFADPIPLAEAFKRGYTDVLIIGNLPLDKKDGFLGTLKQLAQSQIRDHIASGKGYGYSKEVIQAILNYEKASLKAWEEVKKVISQNDPNRRVVVVSPQNGNIGNLEDDPKKLISAFNESAEYSWELFRPGNISYISSNHVGVAKRNEFERYKWVT